MRRSQDHDVAHMGDFVGLVSGVQTGGSSALYSRADFPVTFALPGHLRTAADQQRGGYFRPLSAHPCIEGHAMIRWLAVLFLVAAPGLYAHEHAPRVLSPHTADAYSMKTFAEYPRWRDLKGD